MNADALGLGKEQVKQGGTTPTAVKYQGMSYTYKATSAASKNKALALCQFKQSISNKIAVSAFTAQYDNTTGLFITKRQLMAKK